jgi:hypothetical protein
MEKLINEIMEYESNTFSASGASMTREKAEKVANRLIEVLIEAGHVYFDGVHIAAAYDDCFPKEVEADAEV